MRPIELAELLAKTIPAKLPVLIKGAPGVGKSDVVAQAAEMAEADLIVMHPVVSDPTDAKGMPAIVDGEAEFLPFGELRKLLTAKKLTVAFLDDLGQAAPVVQAAYMQLILARRINGHKISDHVVFVAATNRREDKAGVTSILEPVKSRFATIVELTPSVDDWVGWALNHDVPAEVVAFVRFRPKLLTDPGAPTADIVNRPCPRTVTQMGKIFKLVGDHPESLEGAVGKGFATEFVGFLRVYQSLPSIEGILGNPTKAPVPTDPAALYAVSVALASRADEDNAPAIFKYLGRMPEEFAVMGVRDVLRVDPSLAECPEFVTWAAKHSKWMM